MRAPEDVVLRPVVSEKSYIVAEDHNAYTFIVAPDASKPEISDAVEKLFDGVKVAKVNTLNRKGKRVRNRRTNTVGTRSLTKRAVVTLSEGEIDLYGN
ncbi:MAG: 50S ribosomal protein L23 [Acidimicrobiia bacterium]|nr:50S ribosomal protein L23 [Acidimicrobiia bacterium]